MPSGCVRGASIESDSYLLKVSSTEWMKLFHLGILCFMFKIFRKSD